MSPDTFKSLIIAKHPDGVAADGRKYTDIPALELTQKIVAKYPNGVTADGRKYSDFLSTPTTPSGPDKLTQASNLVGAIFPGQKIGQAIGTGLGYLTEKAKGLFGGQDNSKFYDTSIPSAGQLLGDTVSAGLSVVAPGIGRGASIAGRIGANAALGVGLGGANAIAQGNTTGDVVKSAAFGGALGGGASIAAEGISALTKNLPNWLTKMALPKLDKQNIPYALQNTKIGSLGTLQTHSSNAIQSYEDTVQGILNHPEHIAHPEYTPASLIGGVLRKFPNSEYTPTDIIANAKNIAPKVGKLLNKFEEGTANLKEINTIRKELDQATKSVYTTINRPPETKMLGAALSNAMRDLVKKNAPETIPIFDKYAQEVGLKKALDVAVKKGEAHIGLTDIAAGVAGFAHGGFSGALEAVIAERLLRNPAAQLGVAHLVQGTSSKVAPVANAAFRGLKAPLIKKATDNN